MLNHLRIENVALIDEVEVNFAPGLNILTGETGAGKSILVDSINFLLGGKATRDLVRTGASFAHVEGILECTDPLIEEGLFALGINTSDGQIIMSRTMQVDTGKSVCRINGRTVTVGMLKDAAALLVDVHGQHEHQSLLDAAKQLRLLDQFCGTELDTLKSLLEGFLKKYRETDRALKSLAGVGNRRQEQMDVWRFQLDEITKANLKSGEEETLTAKRNRLSGLDKLHKNATESLLMLYRSNNIQLCAGDQVSRAAGLIAEISRIDPVKEQLYATIVEASQLLQDVVAELRDYVDELDADPNELEKIEARLDLIYRVKKKYGGDVEFVLKKQQELQQNLDNLENSDVEIARLKQVRRRIVTDITAVCDQMNRLRTAAAVKISEGITDVLKDLGMKSARFFISITRKTAFGPDGNDQVEFMISPNPGEPEKPLKRIASGGEMSRIMLAIKTILADADHMDTVIFDEVDTGVSGRTAQQVAEKLMGISRRRQILCITHLPQIAAMADTHFLIEKSVEGQRTVTRVFPLENDAMTNELTRLIGGAQITDATMAAAREMKALADGLKATP
ncbi:MAG: DNA repair protein RecN [Firmicutes bacterium]|nr:DNA repair protein RecN [Bacillota bacterium]